MSRDEALELAAEKDLVLVLVAAYAENPVCKIMNYGKYKFEQSKKEKEAKKAEKQTKAKKPSKTAAAKAPKAESKPKAVIAEATEVAAPKATQPVEEKQAAVVAEKKEQPERKKRVRIEKKEKVAGAVAPANQTDEVKVSKTPQTVTTEVVVEKP